MSQKIYKHNEGMVDISFKQVTRRTAVAQAEIRMNAAALRALITQRSPKGDVLETARVAGIMAAKMTPQLIPMCHPLELNKVKINHELNKSKRTVRITSEVVFCGKTGVEMEAMVAVSVAVLTIYDMLKWADKSMVISAIKLLDKSGGKSGDYHRT